MPPGTLAVPECTLDARREWLPQLQQLVDAWEPLEIIIGLPVSLDGQERAAAATVRSVATEIGTRFRMFHCGSWTNGTPRRSPTR